MSYPEREALDGIHSLDLSDALERPEQLHPLAEPIVVGVLDGLLGDLASSFPLFA